MDGYLDSLHLMAHHLALLSATLAWAGSLVYHQATRFAIWSKPTASFSWWLLAKRGGKRMVSADYVPRGTFGAGSGNVLGNLVCCTFNLPPCKGSGRKVPFTDQVLIGSNCGWISSPHLTCVWRHPAMLEAVGARPRPRCKPWSPSMQDG
jgi:hypothetical protein